jgi:hypothetical protein
MVTTAERLREQGRIEGEAEGIAKGRAVVVEALMSVVEELREQGRIEGEARGIAKGKAEGRAAIIEALMSTAEKLREQGRAEGGAEGKAAIVLKLLTLKLGQLSAADTKRVRTAKEEDLDAWAERVLSATTLAQVWKPEKKR